MSSTRSKLAGEPAAHAASACLVPAGGRRRHTAKLTSRSAISASTARAVPLRYEWAVDGWDGTHDAAWASLFMSVLELEAQPLLSRHLLLQLNCDTDCHMAKVCQVTGKRPLRGNKVSHSNRKSLKRSAPNLHWKRFWIPSEQRFVRIRISASGIRNIDKRGIDAVWRELCSEQR